MSRLSQAIANVAVALIAGAAIAATLHGRVRDVDTVAPLAAPSADLPVLIPLPVSAGTGGSITRSAVLHIPGAMPAGLEEIELRVDTYGGTPQLAGGTLTVAEGCIFQADAGTVRAGGAIVFRRTSPCPVVPAGPVQVALVLRFDEREVQDARCALVAVPTGPKAPLLGIEFNGRTYAPVGRQTTLRSDTTLTRAHLLASMWNRSTAFVWGTFAAALVVIAASGILLVSARPVLAAGGLAMLAAGLALAYAVLVPPLQAPDEPNHMLGYANALGHDGLPSRTEAWAKALHFERITFRPLERFRPSDTTRPHATAWGGHVTPVDEVSRSMLNVRYWRVVARWLGDGPDTTLLRLRVINALVFGSIVGLAALLVSWRLEHGAMRLVVMALLVVPTLPFFAMHMSNYALLVDAYVLLAAGVAAVCHGRTDSPAVGLLLGLGTSMALGASLGSLAMIGVLGAALAAAVLGRADTHAGARYLFWGLFVAGALLINVAPTGADPLAKAGMYRGPAFAVLSQWRWIAIGIGILGVGLDYLVAAIKRPPSALVGLVTARGLQLVAAAIAVGALASLVFTYPVLQPMETRSRWPTPPGYAGEVLRAAVGLGRISHPDWFLSSTFWAGFGWLDAYPGDWLTNLLTGATVVALVGLLLMTARARDSKKARRLLLVGCGAIAALAIYAAGSAVQRTNLHGRYVFGLYLCGVAVCWSVLAVAASSGGRRMQAATTFLYSAIVSINAVCLTFVLRRYF